MATELGQAYVQIVPSAKGISGSIAKEIGSEADSAGRDAGERTGSSLVSTLKKVIVAAGIGKLIGSALNLGGELEQNLGGTEAVFGEFAESIQESATEAYKNMGLSASDYMATANKMGSLFQGSGIEQQKALELTSEAMQRAADVASVMGLDTTMAMESIAGAAKGNFTMMDNLGVAMNATSIQAYALEKGINFEWKTADNAQKAEVAMQMFMERTTQYAGNFARESEETFSGSLGAMKASWQDLFASMATGEDWEAPFYAFQDSLVAFVRNLVPMVMDILHGLPLMITGMFRDLAPDLITAGTDMVLNMSTGWVAGTFDLFARITETIGIMLSKILDAAPELVKAGTTIIKDLITGIVDAIPGVIDQVPVMIDGLLVALDATLPTIIDAGVELFTSLVDKLPEIITKIISVVPVIIERILQTITGLLPKLVDAGVRLLTSLVTNLPQIITTIVNELPKIITSILNSLMSAIPKIIDAGVKLLTALVTNLPQIIMTILRAIPQIVNGIGGALRDKIPQMVEGGFNLFVSLVKNLPGIIAAIVKAVPQIVVGIVKAFASLAWQIIGIGADILKGIWKGIKNGAGWLKDKVLGWAKGLVNGVKNFFGIKSPSKVFAALGEELPAGLAEGVTGNLKPIARAMDEMGNLSTRSYTAEIAYQASEPQALKSLAASVDAGLTTSGSASAKQPMSLTLVMGGQAWKAFVEDISKLQDRTVELALAY